MVLVSRFSMHHEQNPMGSNQRTLSQIWQRDLELSQKSTPLQAITLSIFELRSVKNTTNSHQAFVTCLCYFAVNAYIVRFNNYCTDLKLTPLYTIYLCLHNISRLVLVLVKDKKYYQSTSDLVCTFIVGLPPALLRLFAGNYSRWL